MLPKELLASIAAQAGRVLGTGGTGQRFDQVRNRHYWSTAIEFPDGVGYLSPRTSDFFTTIPGMPFLGASMTERETNWLSPGRVPDDINLEILEVGVLAIVIGIPSGRPNVESTSNLVENLVLTINRLTSKTSLGLAMDFQGLAGPQEMGSYIPYESGPGDTKVTGSFFATGFGGPGCRRKLEIPYLAQHGEQFSMSLELPRAIFVGERIMVARVDMWVTESFVQPG